MVQQIAAAVADEPLGHTVLPRASDRDSNRPHAQTPCGFQNLPLKGVLAIEDEKLRRGITRKGLPKLLRYPSRCRTLCDVVVKNAPPSVRDYEEAVQDAKSECWYGEEIHGGDGFSMIAQEGRPSSRRLGIVKS